MLFNSAQFLLFFPICVFLYFSLPQKFRALWLLVCSYYFYMCWNAAYASLLLISTASTFACGFLVEKAQSPRGRKAALAASICLNLAILFFFKYYNFFQDSMAGLLGLAGVSYQPPRFDVLLPVGISFYTFQALGYSIDVYRKKIPHERNFIRYALFVSFFPQLVAGPIERAENLLPQFKEKHVFSYERAKEGLFSMLWGMFKKVVLADGLGIMVTRVFENVGLFDGPSYVIATVLFAVQIYCDFSGYSDIAVGSAKILGFDLMQNFRQPYNSRTLAEFWSRWHISLSSWLQDYLFEPLAWSGWTRKLPVVGRYIKNPPVYSSLIITFFLSGLWHGASWTYVIWGLWHGVLQVLGKITKKLRKNWLKKLGVNTKAKAWRLWQQTLVFGMVCASYIFFRAATVQDAFYIFGHLLDGWGVLFQPAQLLEAVRTICGGLWNAVQLLIPYLLMESVLHFEKKSGVFAAKWFMTLRRPKKLAVSYAMLLCLLFCGTYTASQFIYFQF